MINGYDIHTHVVPPTIPFVPRLVERDARWAQLRLLSADAATGDVVVDHQIFRTVRRVAFDLDARAEEVQASGSRGQMLSAMPELFATWAPRNDASEYCAAFNEWLAGEVHRFPGLFIGLGLVPVQAPDLMPDLLHQIAQLGLAGVEIPCASPLGPIFGEQYEDFFAAAEELGLLVFIHSVGDTSGFSNGMAGTGAVFPARIGEAVAGLIANGVMERHPGLKLLISHGGGGMAASLARLEFMRGMVPALGELMPRHAHEYARRMWFDHLVFDPDLLASLIRTVGIDRVVYGTDYPFLRGDVDSVLRAGPLPPACEHVIRVDNPHKLLEQIPAVQRPSTPHL